MYQYADDTTNSRASGARVYIEKSEWMVLGKESVGRVEIGLKENKEYFRVLGVNLGIQDGEGRDVQFESIWC